MAMPISSQASMRLVLPCTCDRLPRPNANSTLVPMSTGRPPQRSMARPANGPSTAEASSATVKAVQTCEMGRPRPSAMGLASSAGR